jgi:hypothetical protein
MYNFRVFYRVPATASHKTFLSEDIVSAESREAAIAIVQKRHPEYTELH